MFFQTSPILSTGRLMVHDTPSESIHPDAWGVGCSEARVGGLLGGKCGLLCCKMGSGADGFAPLREALAASDVPISQILPSHAERAVLLPDCRAWLRAGGNVNFTAGVEAGAAPFHSPHICSCSTAAIALGAPTLLH